MLDGISSSVGFAQAWVVRGEERLAPIWHLAPSELGNGSVYVHTTDAVEPHLAVESGLLVTEDTCHGGRFAAQVLRCQCSHDGIHLLASALGEVRTEHSPADDEDYLVTPDQDPALLSDLLVCDADCPHGPHVRVEVDREAWDRWGVELQESSSASPCSTCGRRMSSALWEFRPLVSRQRFRIVRLRQRRTLELDLNVATATDARVVAIGHLVSTQTWSARETHPTVDISSEGTSPCKNCTTTAAHYDPETDL